MILQGKSKKILEITYEKKFPSIPTTAYDVDRNCHPIRIHFNMAGVQF